MNLAGKVVLITGASEGIGAACAASFRRRGARLALTARNEANLRAVAGADGLAIPADLTEPGAPQRIVEQSLSRYGTIDVLINNAGAGLYQPAHSAPMGQARALFELNFFAPLAMAQLASIPMRKQRSGTVANISSIAGLVTLPWLTLYSASKHALISLTEGLRMELRRDGVHTMTVCPGYVNTRFQSHALSGEPPAVLRRSRPLSVSVEKCAEDIAKGVERGARTVVTPWTGWFLAAAARIAPGVVERRLERMNQE